MTSEEEIRCQCIRKLVLANEPYNEYEFKISSSSYDRLKTEFGKDDEYDSYPRLFYDWTRQTSPRAILNQLCNRVESLVVHEGIRLSPDQRLGSTNSPTTIIQNGHSNYEMQPDGVIFLKRKPRRSTKSSSRLASPRRMKICLKKPGSGYLTRSARSFCYLHSTKKSVIPRRLSDIINLAPGR
ncbi:hypothetical protein V1508DRAFT_433685 [Lipomyces doorenjongii]|uniref:uncharacterized protein n=1 Tax=Lipomyces doorenjongii TaxID=383834 RepID=UPI0034CFBCBC